MITGINLSASVDYVLKGDDENPTTWKLGVIPNYLFGKLTETGTANIDTIYKTLQVGIKGWENFSDPFQTVQETICGRKLEVVPISLLETIPMKYLVELSTKILEISQLTEPERKNS